jgi:hypothetical protein
MPTRQKEREQLGIIKGLVADDAFHFSKKVQTLIEDGCFRLEDIKHCVMSAKRIEETEVDELGKAIDGRKYTILGTDTEGYRFYTCGKIIAGGNDERLYFFITAHEDEAA